MTASVNSRDLHSSAVWGVHEAACCSKAHWEGNSSCTVCRASIQLAVGEVFISKGNDWLFGFLRNKLDGLVVLCSDEFGAVHAQ